MEKQMDESQEPSPYLFAVERWPWNQPQRKKPE
jgi:hypothetical protein